jgi:hypothetical protein
VGLDLLIFLADMASEDFVPLAFSVCSSMLIWTDLIESEIMLLGRSINGMDALIPEALGSCCSTRDVIFDEMTFSAVTAPPQMKSVVTAIAMHLTDVRFI